MLLTTAYFPPVSWFALAARDMTLSPDRVLPSRVQLEACENYQKQSYRNRCYILGPQGPQMLQVPVVHAPGAEGACPSASLRDPVRANASGQAPSSLRICTVQVDYSTPWVLRTQRALDTAYQTSAYFDYYRDELFALLEAQPQTLWELNLSLIRWCLRRAGVACELEPTVDFAAPGTEPDDYRYSLHPKRPDTVLANLGLEKPYYQVFRDHLGGFTPGLSILDLLFNDGPGSIRWLKAWHGR